MTAIKARRTRATVIATAAAIVAIVITVALGVAGARTLANSSSGRRPSGDVGLAPTLELPYTATALVGVVDEADRITSVVVLVLDPGGLGGTIVAVAATADAGAGNAGSLNPLASVFKARGPEEFLHSAQTLTGLSYDMVEVIDETRLVQLLRPLGEITIDLAAPVRDSSSGDTWEPGEAVFPPAEAARVLVASDPGIADWYLEPGRQSIWEAVAGAVGDGVSADIDASAAPSTLDEFVERLFAGPVVFRPLHVRPIDDDRVRDELTPDLIGVFGVDSVDAVAVNDRSEVLIVFGAIAPGRIGAPLDAPNFSVTSALTAADLGALDINNSDVLVVAVERLIFANVNIVSVTEPTDDGGAPQITQIRVADPEAVDATEEAYGFLFGEVEVSAADVLVEGVDIEITLGRSFLDTLGGEEASDVAGSS